jgi:hypothetical protein
MKAQVPQFIETETKIIGPFTLKQFMFVAGGVSMVAMEYMLLNGIVFLVAAILSLTFFGSLAFLKVNGQPFLNYLAYMLAYIFGAKRYIYQVRQNNNPLNG